MDGEEAALAAAAKWRTVMQQQHLSDLELQVGMKQVATVTLSAIQVDNHGGFACFSMQGWCCRCRPPC
jgi:hypothetical protein